VRHADRAAEDLLLGVVVDLPEPVAGELRGARAEIGDPDLDAIPAHVTLLPPTPIPPDQWDDVERHLRALAVAAYPFEVHLAGTDTFRPVSPVVYVRVDGGGAELHRLQEVVRSGPLTRDLLFPFHPHVTVAHKLEDGALDRAMKLLADYEAAFTVARFVLYESSDGVWRARRQFDFGPDGERGTPA
jgi:2'-5' RNA ligase